MKPLTDEELKGTLDKKILEKGVKGLSDEEQQQLILSELSYRKKLCSRVYGNRRDELSEVLERQKQFKEEIKKRINKG